MTATLATASTPFTGLSARQTAQLVLTGEVSAVDVVQAALERIQAQDAARAFVDVWPAAALAQAADIDRRRRAAERLPLAGVPLGVKASEGLDSIQTRRLLAAGCVAVGATSVPGPGTDWQTWGATPAGPTLNPHNNAWSPGGSSAGSAVAVATDLVPLATGSDGAGSVRIPAAWCSVVGLKPTNGRLPARDRAGLNIAGPLAKTASDAAAYLDVIAGTNTLTALEDSTAQRFRTAWSPSLGFVDVVPRIAGVARSLLAALSDRDVVEVRQIPVQLSDPEPCWRALRSRHAACSVPPTNGNLSAEALASLLRHQIDQVLRTVDFIATPTTPGPPHGHDGPGATMNVALTWAVNITGHPAISIPAGFTDDGEPVGLQLIGARHSESKLLAVAQSAEDLQRSP